MPSKLSEVTSTEPASSLIYPKGSYCNLVLVEPSAPSKALKVEGVRMLALLP